MLSLEMQCNTEKITLLITPCYAYMKFISKKMYQKRNGMIFNHFENYGSIKNITDDKAQSTLGRGHILIDRQGPASQALSGSGCKLNG